MSLNYLVELIVSSISLMENEPEGLCGVCVDNKATALKFAWIKSVQTGYKTGAV